MKNSPKNIKKFNRGKQMRKKENGITLIALAITIIVLIILAGISITTLTGEKGIINQARTNSENAQKESIIEKIEADLLKEQTKTGDIPSKDKLKEIIQENEYNEGSLGEDSFVTKDGGYTINYDEIIGWENYTGINELEAGKYVNYIDKNGNTIKCIVLYDETYNETYGTNYGVQIISADVVDTVTLGYGDETVIGDNDYNRAINSYNKAIETLNNRAEEYLNRTYASSARCVGSVPDNKNSESSQYYTRNDSWFEEYQKVFKESDTNYVTDINQMEELNVKITSNEYWLASRNIIDTGNSNGFSIHHVDTTGILGNRDVLCSVAFVSNGTRSFNHSKGFRPVFTLNHNISITGGEGTQILIKWKS